MKRILLALAFAISATPVYAQLVSRPVTGQAKVTVTGTATQLSSTALVNGVVVKALASNNAACGTVGDSSVTNTVNGSGNGYILCPGEASSFAVTNPSALWVNGTANDIFTFEGN